LKALLVTRKLESIERLEIVGLAKTAGYKVLDVVRQKKRPNSSYYVSKGLLELLRSAVRTTGAEVLVVDDLLKPNQVFNLQRELGIKVLDRVNLILEIFTMRAGSREAKLQIELAKLLYDLPRVKERIRRLRLGEFPGFRGPGRYELDYQVRNIKQRIAKINEELRRFRKHEESRKKLGYRASYAVVSITGYTNAGKTTLYNALTRENKFVDDMLFSTLSPYSQLVKMEGLPVMVTDTIGFIDDVPVVLIQAFYTTLRELLSSDLLLLVVDASEPLDEIVRKVEASRRVLVDIGALDIPIIMVLNKIDKLREDEVRRIAYELRRAYPYKVVPISALKSLNLSLLEREIVKELVKSGVVISGTVKLPPSEKSSEVLEQLFKKAIVYSIRGDGFILADFKVKKSLLPYLVKLVGSSGGTVVLHNGKAVQSVRSKNRA